MSRSVGVGLVVVTLALGGCGGSAHQTHQTHQGARKRIVHAARAQSQRTVTVPTPGPTGVPASAADVAVIRGWANALRGGDVRAAARFFALPSEMINSTGVGNQVSVLKIQTATEAVEAQESLPCGALLLSTDQRGRYVNALFALTGRRGPGGSGCAGGVGTTARTNFVIAAGRIVEWIRAPSDPGDNGGPTVPAPSTPSPAPQPQPQPGPGSASGAPVV